MPGGDAFIINDIGQPPATEMAPPGRQESNQAEALAVSI